MERARYRDGPGGGSSGAWHGTCGHPRSATSPGTAGDSGDSGDSDPPVPNSCGVPGSGSVTSPDKVSNPGDVPNPGGIPGSGSVPNPRDVPNPDTVPSPRSVPNPGGIHSSGSVPNPGNVPSCGGVPNPKGVSNPGRVPSPGNVPSPGSVPNPRGVPNPCTVPGSGSVTSPSGVSNTDTVPNPGAVPTPGGRCSCRGPPATPPSPTRGDIPCGLGCRHRPAPHDPGDTRRRRPRQRRDNEPPDERPGDTARGQRCLRVARAGVALSLRFLGALVALLLLFLLLILGALRSSLRAASAGLRRCREPLARWLRPPESHSAGGGSGDEEVTRLVAMAQVAEEELDPFRVLGVEATASDAELRRAYRRLAVLVHPDKSRDPRAEAAFKVLRAGWERVSSPERRREYHAKQLAQGELARALGTFLSRLQDELRDAMDAMGCTRCGGRHRRIPVPRDPRSARFCAPCGGWHSAEDGDLWAESSLLGLKVTYLARMDGHVYDVTEWAGCQRVAISPDSHRVPYHLSFGARTATPAGRQRAPPKGSPPSPTEIQDFLARVFQGNPAGEAGGAAGPPQEPPQGPPQAQGGPPRGDTKHKRRKKGRRPLPR